MTGILMIALAMLLVIIQRQRKKQNKQKEKIQRKGPNGTSIKIQFVGDAHQKKQEHEDSPPEEIVDMENLDQMLDEVEDDNLSQEIKYARQSTPTTNCVTLNTLIEHLRNWN